MDENELRLDMTRKLTGKQRTMEWGVWVMIHWCRIRERKDQGVGLWVMSHWCRIYGQERFFPFGHSPFPRLDKRVQVTLYSSVFALGINGLESSLCYWFLLNENFTKVWYFGLEHLQIQRTLTFNVLQLTLTKFKWSKFKYGISEFGPLEIICSSHLTSSQTVHGPYWFDCQQKLVQTQRWILGHFWPQISTFLDGIF